MMYSANLNGQFIYTLNEIIDKFMENEEYDSVVPVEVIKHHMWMNGKPLNYNPEKAPNTQDLPDIYMH